MNFGCNSRVPVYRRVVQPSTDSSSRISSATSWRLPETSLLPISPVTRRWSSCGSSEFVWIESGTFTMGSPESEPRRSSDEAPQHEVTISEGFYLGQHEITQG